MKTTYEQLLLLVLQFAARVGATVKMGFKIPNAAQGNTGYIDSMKPEWMPADICVGVDKFGRQAICVRGKVEGRRPGVEVFFQRYTDNPATWVSGGPLDLVAVSLTTTDHPELRDPKDMAIRWQETEQRLSGVELTPTEYKPVEETPLSSLQELHSAKPVIIAYVPA